MATEPGNRLEQARSLTITASPKRTRNLIGGTDPFDFYSFTLSQQSTLSLALTKLRANADLALLNSSGTVIAASSRSGRKAEAIALTLNPGIYYIQVSPRNANQVTRYQLTRSAISTQQSSGGTTGGNTSPLLGINTGLQLVRGETRNIDGNVLQVIDAEQTASGLTYTLNSLPTHGRLQLNGVNLAVGSQFTQADVNAGRLSYTNLSNVTQLTSDTKDNFVLGLSGSNIVWSERASGVDSFYFRNGETGTVIELFSTLSDTAVFGGISDTNVAFSIFDGFDTEIYLFDGTSGAFTQITNNFANDLILGISGTNLAYTTEVGNQLSAPFFYNGTTGVTTQITDNSIFSGFGGISGANVALNIFDGTDYEVWLYNGETAVFTQLTNNTTDDFAVGISGSNVVWTGTGSINPNTDPSALDTEVWLYNGTSGQTFQITQNAIADTAVGIDVFNVVWNSGIDTDTEVFWRNAAISPFGLPTNAQLTDNNVNDVATRISGSNVVWYEQDSAGVVTDILFYNGTTGITTVLLNSSTVPGVGDLSGSNVALSLSDGNDLEIYFLDFDNPIPTDGFDFTVADSAGGTVSGNFRFEVS
jgi:hypothetical protein